MMLRRCLIVLLLLVVCGGCANKRKAVAKKPPKPWIGTRSLCIFPMAQAPSPEALADAMSAGWKARMHVPEGASLVHIEGAERYPALEVMHIDLSNAAIDYDKDQKKLRPYGKPQGQLKVETLEFVARPLLLERSKMHIDMTV